MTFRFFVFLTSQIIKILVSLFRVRLTLFWNICKSPKIEKATSTKSIHLGIGYTSLALCVYLSALHKVQMYTRVAEFVLGKGAKHSWKYFVTSNFQCILQSISELIQAIFFFLKIAPNFAYIKNNLYKTLYYWSRDIHSIDFLEEGLWLVFPPHFVNDVSRKMFHVLFD